MTEKLMVDRACFERGCACMDNFNVQKVPDDAVWVKKEKEWVSLTDEEIYEVYEATEKLVGEHWDNGGTILMFPTTLYQAFEAKLRERNT